MARPVGICKLCLERKLLESSHFMPRRVYDYFRPAPGIDPIRITSVAVFPTSHQTQGHLLCKDCEDILNKGGEGWIVTKLATYRGAFPLYDLLASVPPALSEHDYAVYFTANHPKVHPAKIIHFAIGMFWKASVHPWRKGSDHPRIDLGEEYREAMRLFLLGKGPFPNNIALFPVVAPRGSAFMGFNDPYEGVREREYQAFFFHLPGVTFTMFAGTQLDYADRALCIHANPDQPILVSAHLVDKGAKLMMETFSNGRKTKALLEASRKYPKSR